MVYRTLADGVAIFHFAFVLFVVLGGLLVLRWPRLLWLHLPAAIWGVVIEVAHWTCPLTYLENELRRRAGLAGYSDGFVAHYLFGLIYPQGLTRGMQFAIAAFVLLVNAGVYLRIFRFYAAPS
jgi:hypothetical protein